MSNHTPPADEKQLANIIRATNKSRNTAEAYCTHAWAGSVRMHPVYLLPAHA